MKHYFWNFSDFYNFLIKTFTTVQSLNIFLADFPSGSRLVCVRLNPHMHLRMNNLIPWRFIFQTCAIITKSMHVQGKKIEYVPLQDLKFVALRWLYVTWRELRRKSHRSLRSVSFYLRYLPLSVSLSLYLIVLPRLPGDLAGAFCCQGWTV